MAEKNVNDRILERVDPSRRDLVKRVLAGATFAAPFIATFSIDGLTASSAQATVSNITNTCQIDAGYVGPSLFQAHLGSGATTANGQAQFEITGAPEVDNDSPLKNHPVEIATTLIMTANTAATNGVVKFLGHNVANIVQGRGIIGPGSIIPGSPICDLDDLLRALAGGECVCEVTATFMSQSFTLDGAIQAANSEIVKINP